MSTPPDHSKSLGTTYASRGQCDTLPSFALPGVNAGGFGGVGYGTDGGCVCGTPDLCCDLPDTLYCTLDSACACFTSTPFPLTKQLSGRWLSDVITYGGCSSTLQVELWCDGGTWHGAKKAASCGADGIHDDPFFVTSTNSPAPCDPFEVTMISLESVVHPNPCCPTGSVTSTYTFTV